MHVALHTFAVFALNNGLSMSVVSRLLGHGSTDITEKVYARFLPETHSSELKKLNKIYQISHLLKSFIVNFKRFSLFPRNNRFKIESKSSLDTLL